MDIKEFFEYFFELENLNLKNIFYRVLQKGDFL